MPVCRKPAMFKNQPYRSFDFTLIEEKFCSMHMQINRSSADNSNQANQVEQLIFTKLAIYMEIYKFTLTIIQFELEMAAFPKYEKSMAIDHPQLPMSVAK
jgi:hypothetical protein